MKNIVHNMSVMGARPSAKSWRTENLPDELCSSSPTMISSGIVVPGTLSSRFCWPPFRTRNRMDSGKKAINKIATTTGIVPPTRNTACQPNCRMTAAATQPAKAEPKENPANMVITAAFRVRFGMYSEVRAIALGIAPPIPNPVKTRNAVSCATDVAVAVSNDPMPNVSAQATRTGLRP